MAHDDDDTGEPGRPFPLQRVRALDTFRAFFRELDVVETRTAELETALRASTVASVVLATAALNVELGVLDAHRALLDAVTSEDGSQWTLPAMQMTRVALRRVLSRGLAYTRQHDASALLVQLYQLGTRLLAYEQTASGRTELRTVKPGLPNVGAGRSHLVVVPRRTRQRQRCRARSAPRPVPRFAALLGRRRKAS